MNSLTNDQCLGPLQNPLRCLVLEVVVQVLKAFPESRMAGLSRKSRRAWGLTPLAPERDSDYQDAAGQLATPDPFWMWDVFRVLFQTWDCLCFLPWMGAEGTQPVL